MIRQLSVSHSVDVVYLQHRIHLVIPQGTGAEEGHGPSAGSQDWLRSFPIAGTLPPAGPNHRSEMTAVAVRPFRFAML